MVPGEAAIGAGRWWRRVTAAVPRREPIGAAAAALRAGRVTCAELVEEALLAVEKFDGELNGVAHLMAESARAEAAALDDEAAAGRWRGPLHGIPITVKDIIDVRRRADPGGFRGLRRTARGGRGRGRPGPCRGSRSCWPR